MVMSRTNLPAEITRVLEHGNKYRHALPLLLINILITLGGRRGVTVLVHNQLRNMIYLFVSFVSINIENKEEL